MTIDRSAMIRVDQAGEYGATRIYAGQLAVMGDRARDSAEIRAMAEQEAEHLAGFDALEADSKQDPRFTATAEELEKQGIDDFQLHYAIETLRRTGSVMTARR